MVHSNNLVITGSSKPVFNSMMKKSVAEMNHQKGLAMASMNAEFNSNNMVSTTSPDILHSVRRSHALN